MLELLKVKILTYNDNRLPDCAEHYINLNNICYAAVEDNQILLKMNNGDIIIIEETINSLFEKCLDIRISGEFSGEFSGE